MYLDFCASIYTYENLSFQAALLNGECDTTFITVSDRRVHVASKSIFLDMDYNASSSNNMTNKTQNYLDTEKQSKIKKLLL